MFIEEYMDDFEDFPPEFWMELEFVLEDYDDDDDLSMEDIEEIIAQLEEIELLYEDVEFGEFDIEPR